MGFDFKAFLLNFEDGTLRNLSIDPTDGFGSDTRVYISNNQVVQIEPDYNIQTFNTWLTDKADSSLMEYSRLGHLMKVTSQPLKIMVKNIENHLSNCLFFEHCQAQHRKIIPLSLF
jgi:methyltransferase-like protein